MAIHLLMARALASPDSWWRPSATEADLSSPGKAQDRASVGAPDTRVRVGPRLSGGPRRDAQGRG